VLSVAQVFEPAGRVGVRPVGNIRKLIWCGRSRWSRTLAAMTILFVDGWLGPDPGDWQELWARALPGRCGWNKTIGGMLNVMCG
jgi:hypothetical protein